VIADAGALLTPLSDGVASLEPLTEEHREPLRAACALDDQIWEIYFSSFAGAHFDTSFEAYLDDPGRRMMASFAGGVLVGMTGFLAIQPHHRVVEIGSTYLAPPARGTGLNARFKRLMIDHALACGFERIEFRIDTRNTRSRRATEKLGAVLEGTLRQHLITWTGHRRDSWVLSILADEWRTRRLVPSGARQ
jgi:RimJ/RimL family protein N-acetyltransferase